MDKFEKLVDNLLLSPDPMNAPIRCIVPVHGGLHPIWVGTKMVHPLPVLNPGDVTTISQFCVNHSVDVCQSILGSRFEAAL